MDRYERWLKRTTPWLTGLALLSLATFVLSAALGRSEVFTNPVNYAAWAGFAIDYAVRLYLVEDRLRFVRTHPLELLAVAVPAIRSVRLLALFGRITLVARRARSERLLLSTALVVTGVVLVGAGLVLTAERDAPGANIQSFGAAVWWAISTVTTVGYGDVYPVTARGQIIGSGVMVIGIGTMGTVTAALAYRFIAGPEPEDSGSDVSARLERIEAQLDELTRALRER